MPNNSHLARLIAERDYLAEGSNRALIHGGQESDELGARIGAVEDLIQATHPGTYNRLSVQWALHDVRRLDAHLTAQVEDCDDCQQQRRPATVGA